MGKKKLNGCALYFATSVRCAKRSPLYRRALKIRAGNCTRLFWEETAETNCEVNCPDVFFVKSHGHHAERVTWSFEERTTPIWLSLLSTFYIIRLLLLSKYLIYVYFFSDLRDLQWVERKLFVLDRDRAGYAKKFGGEQKLQNAICYDFFFWERGISSNNVCRSGWISR